MIGADRMSPSRRTVLAATVVGAAGVVLALAGTPRRSEPRPGRLVVATGPQGAVYLEVGRDLARAITALSPTTRVDTLVTAATVDNLRLLARGHADLGLASLDAAAVDPRVGAPASPSAASTSGSAASTSASGSAAASGSASGSGGVLAISRWYDSFLHLVVPAGSTVRDLQGCARRRVGVGATGSGTEFTALRLLALAGIRPAAAVRLGQAEAMAALARGALDAAFSLTGFPTPAISTLAARQAVRLIPLARYADLLDRSIPRVYRSGTLPAGTYRGVSATDTVYVPNVLLARPGLPDAAVRLAIEALLSARSRRYWTHPDSRRIDVRTAIATGPVPLHPVALGWLRAHKP